MSLITRKDPTEEQIELTNKYSDYVSAMFEQAVAMMMRDCEPDCRGKVTTRLMQRILEISQFVDVEGETEES